MSLHRPRRIFRSSSRFSSPRLNGTVVAGAAAALGVGLLVTMGVTTDLFGRAPAQPLRAEAEPRDVAVIDGGTLRLRDRVLRLRGITVPDRGTSCHGRDCGAAATAELAGLVRDRRIDCVLDGRDSRGRPWATCDAGGRDLSTAMVSAGWARAEDDALRGVEQAAQRRRTGVWAGEL